ncbi:MAG: hypothetical protein GF307_09815 [candidate division Zixibacteria bacterium]|nr:hypothetical protein [candidate division Zixibacteria bacterium]
MKEKNDMKYKDALDEIVCQVMEQTAFVFPEPADLSEGVSLDEHEMLIATLAFNGDRDGEVSLIAPVNFCMELSANLLGKDIDETCTPEEYSDAAKEMLNIITGQLLTKVFGEEAVFNLTAPVTKSLTGEEMYSLIENNVYSFNMADEHPVLVTLTLKEKAHEH